MDGFTASPTEDTSPSGYLGQTRNTSIIVDFGGNDVYTPCKPPTEAVVAGVPGSGEAYYVHGSPKVGALFRDFPSIITQHHEISEQKQPLR